MKSLLKNALIPLIIYAIAMAFLETSIVIYLRELYYPAGFAFPLQPINKDIAIVEIIREFATLVMLITVAYFTGKNLIQRFASFIIAFAVWDIFYYVFLKIFLNWPESLITWDVLFLIPVTWVGPVYAPIVLSVLMLILGMVIHFYDKQVKSKLRSAEWKLLIMGSVVSIISFTEDFVSYLINIGKTGVFSGQDLFAASQHYIPQEFNSTLFLISLVIIVIPILTYSYRNHSALKQLQSQQLF